MSRNIVRLATIFIATAALSLQAGSAYAKTTNFQDAVGDTNNRGLMDIGRVTVVNTSKQISVKFRIPKATTLYPSATLAIYLDTNRKHKGPEYVWGAGIPGDSAFTVIKKNGKYGKTWAGLVEDKKCGKTVRETFDLDSGVVGITIKKKKGCLSNVKSVRTNVQTTVNGEFPSNGDYDEWVTYDQTESDFYPAKKKYSAWVNR
jgi:hypothetical protein